MPPDFDSIFLAKWLQSLGKIGRNRPFCTTRHTVGPSTQTLQRKMCLLCVVVQNPCSNTKRNIQNRFMLAGSKSSSIHGSWLVCMILLTRILRAPRCRSSRRCDAGSFTRDDGSASMNTAPAKHPRSGSRARSASVNTAAADPG